jgi:chorismate synthase
MLRYHTAGESHGKALIAIIEGMPAGLAINIEEINQELLQRQKGYGRGGRMNIESDEIDIISGVRAGLTTGSPIAFSIRNRDWDNWSQIMAIEANTHSQERAVRRPRPGHADYPGAIKYNQSDLRNVLERASARETAARVAAGAFFKKFLSIFDIHIYSQVVAIGSVKANPTQANKEGLNEFKRKIESSPVRCVDENAAQSMIKAIDQAKQDGESLGGVFEVGAIGIPPGLGNYTSWEERLDARLSGLLMTIPAIKAVEIGDGVENAAKPGSRVHDEILFEEEKGAFRLTNHAGGIEGGMSNGEIIWARAYMKPIPTLYKPLGSVNTETWMVEKANVERSDICAVPAASVVGEAMLAFGIAAALKEKFSGDFMDEIISSFDTYCDYVRKVWKWEKI